MTTSTLVSRPYAGEAELETIADFLNLVEAHDRVEEGSSVAELRVDFSEPGFDPTTNVRTWEDGDGRMVAFAQLFSAEETVDNDGFLWFKIHPQARGGELEGQVLAWADELLRARGRSKLRVTARDIEPERVAVLERLGFEPVRFFLRMRRPLAEPIATAELPPGYTLRQGPHDPQAWVDMYNESFVDHFNHHEHDADWVRHYQQEADYRPDLDLAAVAPDGTLAGFAWCSIHTQENARTGRRDGWIGLLGTRRGHRRIGLGRALLLAGLERIRAAGMETAWLGVDAESPTGATRLYESVGFEVAYSRSLHSRDVSL